MLYFAPVTLISIVIGLANAFGAEYESSPQNCTQLPPNLQLINQTYVLPDPFTFLNGQTVASSEDWSCRRDQIRSLFQEYELGYKPARPPILTSSFQNNNLVITTGFENKTITFSVPIKYPNVANATAPYPAVIALESVNIPIPSNVAVLTFNTDEIAQENSQSSRGVGLFYNLFGSNATAGALMAWSWAISRIIDALEITPGAKINPQKLAVTGCSRWGKGAMVAGAFDDRIALTIPQESGSGGDACWRTSRDMLVNQHLATQTAWEIVTENVWFSSSFNYFGRDNYTVGLLPVDHHELAGLIAPRGLYSTSNVGFVWLGDWSNWECMKAANKIYQALGVVDNQGFSQDGPHDHCSFPGDQDGEISAFFQRFLMDVNVDTAVFRTVGNWAYDPNWAPWNVPTLT